MKFKKFCFILIFALIFSVGSVCAAELNSTSVEADNDSATIAVEMPENEKISAVEDNATLKSSENEVLSARAQTTIVCNDMTTTTIDPKVDGYKGPYFTVTLLGTGGFLANKLVQIGFNGVVYDRYTDANGVVKLQVNLAKPDTYTFAVCFLGDNDNAASFEVAKVIVKKQTPQLTTANKNYKAKAKTKTLTATLKTARGKYLVGKQVKFTVNGKTYSVKTNKKGVATLKVNIKKKKTYNFTVRYVGDNTYNGITKKGKLVIK